MTAPYYVSYGPLQAKAKTLQEARDVAKRTAKTVLYAIRIVHKGDVVETWVPKIDLAGRVKFRRYKGDRT